MYMQRQMKILYSSNNVENAYRNRNHRLFDKKRYFKSVFTLCDIFGLFWNKNFNEVVHEKNSIF